MYSAFTRQRIGVVLGPLVFLVQYLFVPIGMPETASAAFAGTLWIAIWWVTEAVPIPVTALLPAVLFPLTGVVGLNAATTAYADPIVFLLLGGFLLALAVERWGLHERIALAIIGAVGFSSNRLVLGFMLATGGLSMWISNTATAMMMVPIGTAVIVHLSGVSDESPPKSAEPTDRLVHEIDRDPETLPSTNFGLALLLGIAYGASIGGAATLIGSPPNAIFAGVAESALGVRIGFLEWLTFAGPVSAAFLLLAWGVLVTTLSPETATVEGGESVIRARRTDLGAMSKGERRTLWVFGLVVIGWVSRPFVIDPIAPAVTDTTVALVGAILLFVVPVDLRERIFLLDWETTAKLPWGVLVLLGAGFSIATAFQTSGLDRWIADGVGGVSGMGLFTTLALVATVVIFLTEVNSNTATASVFIPIAIGIGSALGVPPLSLMAVAALAASYAFMLPVATPPNAIVFGSGYLTVPQMARTGFWLNLLGIAIATGATYLWLPFVLS